jgi:hypothetical protein
MVWYLVTENVGGICFWRKSRVGQLSSHASVSCPDSSLSRYLRSCRVLFPYIPAIYLGSARSIPLSHLLLSTSNVSPRYAIPNDKKALSFLAWRYAFCHVQKLVTDDRFNRRSSHYSGIHYPVCYKFPFWFLHRPYEAISAPSISLKSDYKRQAINGC